MFAGSVKCVNAEHLSKAPYPILVTLKAIVNRVKVEQPRKAQWPMCVTLEGIVK
jgi:hypothetical protein